MKIHETHLPVRASALDTDKNPVEVVKIFQRAESLSNPAAFSQVTGNVAINVEKKIFGHSRVGWQTSGVSDGYY